jgi:hypothetical protein
MVGGGGLQLNDVIILLTILAYLPTFITYIASLV